MYVIVAVDMAFNYGTGSRDGSGSGRKEKFSMPGPREPDYPLCTPAQIRDAELEALRQDKRIWAAYERGWFDLMNSCLNSQLMQGDMPALYCNAPLSVYPVPAGEVNDRRGRCLQHSPEASSSASEFCQGDCHGSRGQCCCKCEAERSARHLQPAQDPATQRKGYPRPAAVRAPRAGSRPPAPPPPMCPRPAAPAPLEGAPRRPISDEFVITARSCSANDISAPSKAMQYTVKIKIVSPDSTEIEFTKTTHVAHNKKSISSEPCSDSYSDRYFK